MKTLSKYDESLYVYNYLLRSSIYILQSIFFFSFTFLPYLSEHCPTSGEMKNTTNDPHDEDKLQERQNSHNIFEHKSCEYRYLDQKFAVLEPRLHAYTVLHTYTHNVVDNNTSSFYLWQRVNWTINRYIVIIFLCKSLYDIIYISFVLVSQR